MASMKSLRAHREGWEFAKRMRANDIAALTPQTALAQFRSLVEEFALLLQQTEPLFRPERIAYLTEFQERLRRLSAWQKKCP